MAKSALIIGVTGQDGSYLAQLLLNKGYRVHGLKRRSSLFNTSRIDHLYADPHEEETSLTLHHGDLTDGGSLIRIIQETRPDEIYNLGAMSHVKVSFEVPEYTANVDGLGTLRILEAIRILKLEKSVKLFQASTSELYGDVSEEFQNELTPMRPQSPYAAAKLYAYWSVVNYRQAYGLFATNGILFNHESPVRGETFVTRKITRGIAQVVTGVQDTIYLGNLDAKRDWGHAEDYVMAMWLMLQQDKPDDFVIATGTSTSVRDFLRLSFLFVGIDVEFTGKGVDEKVIVAGCKGEYQLPKGKVVCAVDPYYFRPCEVNHLRGDATKARRELGWTPKHDLNSIIREMMTSDLAHFEKEKFFRNSSGNPA